MGQVYRIAVSRRIAVAGSSAHPHAGQAPGDSSRTSGCIGQV
jgi:hypothetical protein